MGSSSIRVFAQGSIQRTAIRRDPLPIIHRLGGDLGMKLQPVCAGSKAEGLDSTGVGFGQYHRLLRQRLYLRAVPLKGGERRRQALKQRIRACGLCQTHAAWPHLRLGSERHLATERGC